MIAGKMRGIGAVLLVFGTLGLDTVVTGSEIADSAMRGDLVALRTLLGGGGDVNTSQADGATALHWAAHNGNLELTALLLEAGANVSTTNLLGISPLSLACSNGDAAIVELLLNAGADPNEALPNGETALMMAARTGNIDILNLLIDRGAEVNARENLRETTPLMWAVDYGNPKAAQTLINRGADVSSHSKTVLQGRRPYLAPTPKERIDEAVRGTGQAGTAIPINLGDGTPITSTNQSVLLAGAGVAEVSQIAPRRRPRELTGGLTSLIFAARRGDLESARVLIDAGADVNQVSEFGWTALLAATQNRYYLLGKFLLDHGADPSIGNKGGWTPLYIATDNRNIESGDYPTRRADMDHFQYIELLLDHGADPNARMKSSTETRTIFTHQWLREDGATPFLRAAQSSDTALMQLLIQSGADPLIATENGTTPMMVASGIGWVEGVTYEWSEEQNIDTINWLLELGADVNAVDRDGRSALHGAAHKGRNEVVKILADHGADLGHRDFGSRDSIHNLLGVTWQAIDYADGLVRVGVQSSIGHPATAALIRELMVDADLPVPPEGRTLESICVTDLCR